MNAQQILRILAEHAFPDTAEAPQLLETHISWVILTDHYAFKIKKPVQLNFVDFKSLTRRGYACRREVLLNNRCSEGIYLGRVPIRETPTGIQIGAEEGTLIDWAVQMRRLDTHKQMDHMLANDEVKPRHIIALGQQIAHCHEQVPIIRKYPPLETLQQRVADLFAPNKAMGSGVSYRMLEMGRKLVPILSDFLKRYYPHLVQRARDGFFRDAHGDLHCANIFLYDRPILFDCLDFSDELRRVDVLDEIAFLVMDLEARGQDIFAELLLNTYLEHHYCLKDEKDLQLFYFFKLYRAGVRAKVSLLHPGQAQQSRASRYLDLIEGYLEQVNIEAV